MTSNKRCQFALQSIVIICTSTFLLIQHSLHLEEARGGGGFAITTPAE